jgi:hypothetical protein
MHKSEYTNNAMKVWPGRPYPLGATWDGAGVNFALFSVCGRLRKCRKSEKLFCQVITRWTARGTHKGTLMSLAPNNKAATVTGIDIDRIAMARLWNTGATGISSA